MIMLSIRYVLPQWRVFLFALAFIILPLQAQAFLYIPKAKNTAATIKTGNLAPHKAAYQITLTNLRAGAPITNIHGTMGYETRLGCEGWLTNHQFDLTYEYIDAPGTQITADFSTEEQLGKIAALRFSALRTRNGTPYEDYQGQADSKKAQYSNPKALSYDLPKGTLFPVAHTAALLKEAQKGTRIYNAFVFDGSDGEGPVEINAIIGGRVNAPPPVPKKEAIDPSLLRSAYWPVRMAVFPLTGADKNSSAAEYEMTARLHQNGVLSDMVIDYDTFSVKQTLVSLKKLSKPDC